MIEQIEADDIHGDNGPYNAFVRNIAYERNIDLYSAPQSAVLGCEAQWTSRPLEKSGNTTFSIEAYGRRFLEDEKMMAYERAKKISYLDLEHFPHYVPFQENYGFLKDVSYFYTSRPYFLSSQYTWPQLGAEYENCLLEESEGRYCRRLSQTIPAEDRYKSGKETYISKPTQVKPSVP